MITLDDIKSVQGADDGTVIVVNAWLSKHDLPRFDTIPNAIIQAAQFIAKAYLDGKLYQDRTEGMIKAKSATAGSVSTSKTFADGADGQPMSGDEMIALDLIKPYLKKASIWAVPTKRA
ncbi:hypothetical protein B0181_11615 [Moraxella caviae]|uniref:Uncharacterized protein n=1 Tax=Moraxella caviae TaxID=34060 RepID=A0A1S9ZSZ0_9GAMM|nr:hypothetical protein [Moraxella caviae]OOR86639.1 hypothetical protein B0181_11615 [Moraxella caviae]STZ14514.1 Uncharacterised protein [Moraxella caviae]VEW11306.1 Uncharacterised protein [Moraxella caviae]